MFLNLKKSDFLVIVALSLPKFVVGFITSMIIPIFPSLIMIHFNNSIKTGELNLSALENKTKYNYHQLSVLFVAKNLGQILLSPIIGCFIDFVGSTVLLLIGTVAQIVTVSMYGIGNAYYLLLLGRLFEAISSTSVNCAAAAFVAYRFKDHKQRGFVYGVNGLSLCIGTAIGPAYGGVIYQFYGKTVVFMWILVPGAVEIIFAISLIITERRLNKKCVIELEIDPTKNYVSSMENFLPILITEVLPTSIEVDNEELDVVMNGDSQVVVKLRNSLVSAEEKVKLNQSSQDDGPSHNFLMFIKDPYFLIAIGTFPVVYVIIFLLFSTLPLYMSLTFKASESQQGLIWTVNIFGYILGFVSGNVINTKLSSFRHIILTAYIVLHALGIVVIPFVPVWWSVAIPLCALVHVHLIVEVIMAPILATIVETRHMSKFGIMSGIIMMTIAITATLGSFLGPILLSTIGFKYMNIAVACVNVLYSPFYLFLKRFCQVR